MRDESGNLVTVNTDDPENPALLVESKRAEEVVELLNNSGVPCSASDAIFQGNTPVESSINFLASPVDVAQVQSLLDTLP